MITVQLLGGASLRSGNVPLAGPPTQRHRIALLAMIVAAWPQPLSRDRAMAMLWPERDLANARRLLNLAVHVLRTGLGEGAISSAGDGLLLNPSLVNCDFHALRAAIAADAPDRIARLYTGPLLDGFHLDDSNEFAYWLDERRVRRRAARHTGTAEEDGRRARQSGHVPQAGGLRPAFQRVRAGVDARAGCRRRSRGRIATCERTRATIAE